jgi:hypothetical protein
LKCRCNQSFCTQHFFFNDHACSVDYVKLGVESATKKEQERRFKLEPRGSEDNTTC